MMRVHIQSSHSQLPSLATPLTVSLLQIHNQLSTLSDILGHRGVLVIIKEEQ